MGSLIEAIKNFILWLLSLFGLGNAGGKNNPKAKSAEEEVFIPKRIPFKPPEFRSFQEAYDKSWEFLNKLADKVVRLFSNPDKEKLMKLARTMHQAGMTYIHEVPYFNRPKNVSRQQGKEQDKGRGR